MYKKILVTLDATEVDRAVLEHVKQLATLCGSKIVLMHVVDGWAGRQFGENAVSPEVKADQDYLEKTRKELADAGLRAECHLAFGEPGKEIVKFTGECGCDLIAMSTHGHKWLGDLVLGSTASHVQHRVSVPVLLIRSR